MLQTSTENIKLEYLLSRVAIGYDEGTIMIKIGREEPVASMDNSGKIIWAKHNEIQTVNIKSIGLDEVCKLIRVSLKRIYYAT